MSANNPSIARHHRPRIRQEGTTAIEFALLAVFFFTLVFGIIEVARLMYVYNTLQEVTRRAAMAAANVYPRDAAAIQKIKTYAVFRDSPGELPLAPPVTDADVRIEYLALKRAMPSGDLSLAPIDTSSLPSCAAQNRQICMRDPNADNCIRFVQVRVCSASDSANCNAVISQMLLPLLNLRVPFHKATTIVPAESLGYRVGMSPCPMP